MTVYECPVCDKGLVTEDEPPGIIHKCDDCGVLMTASEVNTDQ